MNTREFYALSGGNYEMALGAFGSEERLHKFLIKYFDDPNYQRLCEAVEADDIDEAYEAVHALKGITGMFFLTPMSEAIVAMVEQLRPKHEPIDKELFLKVKEEREKLEALIKEVE